MVLLPILLLWLATQFWTALVGAIIGSWSYWCGLRDKHDAWWTCLIQTILLPDIENAWILGDSLRDHICLLHLLIRWGTHIVATIDVECEFLLRCLDWSLIASRVQDLLLMCVSLSRIDVNKLIVTSIGVQFYFVLIWAALHFDWRKIGDSCQILANCKALSIWGT